MRAGPAHLQPAHQSRDNRAFPTAPAPSAPSPPPGVRLPTYSFNSQRRAPALSVFSPQLRSGVGDIAGRCTAWGLSEKHTNHCVRLSQGPGKKWEHYELTANGKPMRIPMHVKKGDTVQIISGDDKGKVGEIAKVRFRPPPGLV